MVIENGTGLENFLKTQVRFKTSMGFYHSALDCIAKLHSSTSFSSSQPWSSSSSSFPWHLFCLFFFLNLGFSLNADRNLGFGLITYWMLGFYLIASVVDI